MNLIHSNDRPGCYPPSWYAATVTPLAPFPPLRGETRADVCVIGAGYTGLSAALHLAEAGLDVVLVEAQRVGFGASGRNGGQLGSGQRVDQRRLERMLGRAEAARLWALAEDSKALVRSLIARHAIACHLRPGVAHLGCSAREVADAHALADHLGERYGYRHLEKLDRDAAQTLCPSPRYLGGTLDHDAAHLHPLAFALGLARAARDAGVRIFERSEVHRVEPGRPARVLSAEGVVRAGHVILAGNGYLGGLDRRVAARVMPINNFIVATEPLGEAASRVLSRDVAVADSRFVINYFRLSHDRRLLFGGGESYGWRFPRDIAALVRKPMLWVFPHLRDVRIDYAWGGTLAITMQRLPHLARLGPNMLSAAGYSGHGLGIATLSGKLMADAIAGQAEGFDTMARIPTRPFPGGALMRWPLLVLAMSWFSLRDRLGV
ncbi:MAG: FAD-binding oxidoreductase [Roseovarius sp.]